MGINLTFAPLPPSSREVARRRRDGRSARSPLHKRPNEQNPFGKQQQRRHAQQHVHAETRRQQQPQRPERAEPQAERLNSGKGAPSACAAAQQWKTALISRAKSWASVSSAWQAPSRGRALRESSSLRPKRADRAGAHRGCTGTARPASARRNRPPRNDAQREEPGLRHGRGRFGLLRRQKSISAGEPAERPSSAASSSGRTPAPGGKAPPPKRKSRARTLWRTRPTRRAKAAGARRPRGINARAARRAASRAKAQRQHPAGQQMAVWQERLLGERRACGQQQARRRRAAKAPAPRRRRFRPFELSGRGKADDPAQQQRGTAAQYAALSASGSSSPVPTAKYPRRR